MMGVRSRAGWRLFHLALGELQFMKFDFFERFSCMFPFRTRTIERCQTLAVAVATVNGEMEGSVLKRKGSVVDLDRERSGAARTSPPLHTFTLGVSTASCSPRTSSTYN